MSPAFLSFFLSYVDLYDKMARNAKVDYETGYNNII